MTYIYDLLPRFEITTTVHNWLKCILKVACTSQTNPYVCWPGIHTGDSLHALRSLAKLHCRISLALRHE